MQKCKKLSIMVETHNSFSEKHTMSNRNAIITSQPISDLLMNSFYVCLFTGQESTYLTRNLYVTYLEFPPHAPLGSLEQRARQHCKEIFLLGWGLQNQLISYEIFAVAHDYQNTYYLLYIPFIVVRYCHGIAVVTVVKHVIWRIWHAVL